MKSLVPTLEWFIQLRKVYRVSAERLKQNYTYFSAIVVELVAWFTWPATWPESNACIT